MYEFGVVYGVVGWCLVGWYCCLCEVCGGDWGSYCVFLLVVVVGGDVYVEVVWGVLECVVIEVGCVGDIGVYGVVECILLVYEDFIVGYVEGEVGIGGW